MSKTFAIVLSAGLLLGGCQSAPVVEPAPTEQSGEWKPSTLSENTIAAANAAVLDYRTCLAKEADAKAMARNDPREITNAVLKVCENRLSAIKSAYDSEQVPAAISERYMRKTRSQGAQAVLRSVMAFHAMRAAEEEEARDVANKKK